MTDFLSDWLPMIAMLLACASAWCLGWRSGIRFCLKQMEKHGLG